jgi:hypothetical protein
MKRLLYLSILVMTLTSVVGLNACRGLKEKKSANHQPFSPHQYKKPQQKKH